MLLYSTMWLYVYKDYRYGREGTPTYYIYSNSRVTADKCYEKSTGRKPEPEFVRRDPS